MLILNGGSLVTEELYFSPSEVTVSNLSGLTERASVLSEMRMCEIYELAKEASDFALELLRSDTMSFVEVLLVLSELSELDGGGVHSDSLPQNKSALEGFLSNLRRQDKIIFTSLFLSELTRGGITVSEASFLPAERSDERFVYVKNSFADEAYDVFSEEFVDPRVRYAENFRDAISLLSDGTVSYSLLPMEERGVRIPSISQLIFSHDQKIVSVTPVFGFDGTADMKYALVSKACSVPTLIEGDDRYLEIRLQNNGEASLSELLLALESLSVELYRVNSIFFDGDGGRSEYYSLIFKKDEGDFSLLLTYLTLFMPSHTVVGLYKNLEM